MDLGLAGKKVVVTGASKGIGLACAEVFAAEGAHVVMVARDAARLSAAAAELKGRHQGPVEIAAADLSRPADREALWANHRDTDILVNNAGAIPAGDLQTTDAGALGATPGTLKVMGYINLTRRGSVPRSRSGRRRHRQRHRHGRPPAPLRLCLWRRRQRRADRLHRRGRRARRRNGASASSASILPPPAPTALFRCPNKRHRPPSVMKAAGRKCSPACRSAA